MRNNYRAGLSLVELLVSIAIASILVLITLQVISRSYVNWRRESTKTQLQTNTKTAVETVAQVIRSAKSVESQNSQPDPNAPDSQNPYSWTSATGSGATLILATPARDANGDIIFIDDTHTSLYTDNVIFYLEPSSDILYRRTIANTSAPNNAATTTCPPEQSTPACPPDSKVVADIANLTTTYLDAAGDVVASPSGTEAVKYELSQTRTIGSQTFQSSYGTTATLRNK